MRKILVKSTIILLCFSIFLIYPPNSTAMSLPLLNINPSSVQDLRIRRYCTVNVTISNVTDLCAWEIRLFYRKTIVNATQAVEGPFLNASGSTMMIDNSDPNYNSTHGLINLADSLLGEEQGVNGSGVLAQITFRGMSVGNSTLHFEYAPLLNRTGSEIPYDHTDGYLNVIAVHDVAILRVDCNKNVTCQGYGMFINATAQDQGDFIESFNVTAYYNGQQIGTKTVSNLNPNANETVTFAWNTAGTPKANYTVSANASSVQGETDLADNQLADGTVYVSKVGDTNGDGKVNLVDVFAVAKAFNAVREFGRPFGRYWHSPICSSCPHSPNVDINNDGKINLIDYFLVCRNYGQ